MLLFAIVPTTPYCPPPPSPTHRVFLFVDPELVSPSVCSALLLEIEAAQVQQTPEACMRHVVSHTLQAALGEACQASALHRKLQVTETRAPAAHTRHSLSSFYFCLTSPSPSPETMHTG